MVQEKTLKGVIRGVPKSITDEDVKQTLSWKDLSGFRVVAQNSRGKNNNPAPRADVT